MPALATGKQIEVTVTASGLVTGSLLGHQLFPDSMGSKVSPRWPVAVKNPYFKSKLEFALFLNTLCHDPHTETG